MLALFLAAFVLSATALDASAASGPCPETATAPCDATPAIVPVRALDLDALEKRLRATTAIGVLTKLSLRNEVEDLVAGFRKFHEGSGGGALPELRQRFNLLLLKVLSLLQDRDPGLAHDIAASRDALWGVLADPRKLARVRT